MFVDHYRKRKTGPCYGWWGAVCMAMYAGHYPLELSGSAYSASGVTVVEAGGPPWQATLFVDAAQDAARVVASEQINAGMRVGGNQGQMAGHGARGQWGVGRRGWEWPDRAAADAALGPAQLAEPRSSDRGGARRAARR